MADPLGFISGMSAGAGGAGGVRGAGAPGQTPAGGIPADPNAPSFKDALMQNIEKVNKLQQEATAATEDFATGKRQDLENVLLATQKADTAFRMLLSVRSKVQAAYDELKQVRI
jgi:flagellar hook-basal body complex protein FliE